MSTVIGLFQKNAKGDLTGKIETARLHLSNVVLVKVPGKKPDQKGPDYKVHIEGFECGAGWIKPYGNEGKSLISVAMGEPTLLPDGLNASLFDAKDGKGMEMIWNPPRANGNGRRH